jgi:chemosensory pili system protein ChpA (sensor histidine kinase/response regulator)
VELGALSSTGADRLFVAVQLSGRKEFSHNCCVASTLRRPSVLIVEDDPELRTLYRTTLALAGYTVMAVGDGVDALRRIENDAPDLIVLDLGLPLLGGRDVHREIMSNAETAAIPIVVVTGDTNRLERAEFRCLLEKPLDLDELVAAVERCLHRSR